MVKKYYGQFKAFKLKAVFAQILKKKERKKKEEEEKEKAFHIKVAKI